MKFYFFVLPLFHFNSKTFYNETFKKKCLLIAGIVAISGYGISRSIEKDTAELNALTLANIEALADGEWGFWDGVGNTLKGQGWTKDEYPEWKPCQEQVSIGFYSIYWEGKRKICRDGGNENCYTVWCEE